MRGMTMLTTVAAVAAVLVLTTLAVGATWQLSAGGGDDGRVDVAPVTVPQGTVPGASGGDVAASARGTVLRSDAQAIAQQVSLLAMGGGIEGVDVDEVLADYPREAGGVRIEADASSWRANRTITVSSGGVSLCVRFDDEGRSTTTECR